MNKRLEIRLIELSDAPSTLEIYKPYVLNTIISFEYEVPGLDEWVKRIEEFTQDFPWLVASHNDKIIGYAYASKHRHRTAYQWSCESAIYLATEAHGNGVGRMLYETLFGLLQLQGYYNMYAGISLPNEKSVEFHKALQFEEIGVFKKIGFKHGNWHDTVWFQRALNAHNSNPVLPKKLSEVRQTSDFQAILFSANDTLNRGKS